MPEYKTEKDLFLQECNNINNNKIREVVLNTVLAIPEYFYIVPSSSSGKYHPSDEISEGGLVRHTLKTVKVAKEMARMYDLSEYKLELCIAAILLHDCCKNGKKEDSGHTEFLHPKYAAELVIENNFYNKRIAKKIANLVKPHMGRWNTSKYSPDKKLPKPKTKLQKFVHLCDYISSRKEFNIEI